MRRLDRERRLHIERGESAGFDSTLTTFLFLGLRGMANHALGRHPPHRQLATPNLLLSVIKLWYTLPALLHSPNRCIMR